MGKKGRRRQRHREEREAGLAQQEADLRDGMVEFSTQDLVERLGYTPTRTHPAPHAPSPGVVDRYYPLPDLGAFVHPTALRAVLDWPRVVETAAAAGYGDPTKCGVISFKSNGKRTRLVFWDCPPGHPAALLTPFELAALETHRQTHDELRTRPV